MKKKYNLKTVKLPAWLFVAVMIPLYEAFLYFATAENYLFKRFATILILAMGFSCALALIVSLFPPKVQKWLAFSVVFLLAVLYITQYFIRDAYQVFMTFEGILNGAGNVATNYLDVVVSLLLRNLWKILLLLLPIALYARFVRVPRTRWLSRFCLLCVALSMYMMGLGLVYRFDMDAEKFSGTTAFNDAVESFGLNMGIGMDLLRGDGKETLEFEISDFAPVTEAPTEAETREPVSAVPTATELPGETVPQETEPAKVLQPHTLGLDFQKLAEAEEIDQIAAVHQYMASQTPAMENEYTGLFAGKNLILITAEAFSQYVVDEERTPTLYRMMTEGIYFTDYYQPTWGSGTTGGEYSNLLSLVPYDSTRSMQEVIQQDIFHTMGKQLQKQGYASAAFHNNDYTYYNRHKTHTHLGYDIFMGEGNGMEEGLTRMWPQSDEEMFKFTIPQYIDKQPFSLYYMTVSGHATYTFDSNSAARKNQEYVKDLDYSGVVKAYLACNMEMEHSMAYLLEQLEEKGIADDTVVVIATDHYPYGLVPSETWGTKKNYLRELIGQPVSDSFIRDKSALIIWSGCLEDMDLRVDDPVMSLDILPTLSNLFGVEYDSRLMCGRDIFSEEEPLAFWLDGSWKTDKGSYSDGKFTPAEGVTVDEEYIQRVKTTISNKKTFSQAVTFYNYFNYITAALDGSNPTAAE
ncbi:MAG: hypothetical protein E7431_00145 [Ruminococcaceae bacterium]|nr:hypothetical protein [Oscillospiraceae bacterium]